MVHRRCHDRGCKHGFPSDSIARRARRARGAGLKKAAEEAAAEDLSCRSYSPSCDDVGWDSKSRNSQVLSIIHIVIKSRVFNVTYRM